MRQILAGAMVFVVSTVLVVASAGQAAVKTEAEYDALMKALDEAFQGTRKSLEAKAAPEAAKHAAAVADALQKAVGFWALHKKEDAVGWAKSAIEGAQLVQKASTAGDIDGATKAWTEMRANCRSCHMAYRTKNEDGTFSIKAGTIGSQEPVGITNRSL